VDGNRDKTLALVWKLTVRFSLGQVVSASMLQNEIQRVAFRFRKNQIWRSTLGAICADPELDANVGLSDDPNLAALVLQWSQVVVAGFGQTVENFDKSLASGRALCLLVHYYKPDLLPTAAISDQHDRKSERANFAALRAACDALGNVPFRLHACDSEHPPDSRLAFAFIVFLCARLLSTSDEVKAARTIQTMWALHCARKKNGDDDDDKVCCACWVLRSERSKTKKSAHKSLQFVGQSTGSRPTTSES